MELGTKLTKKTNKNIICIVVAISKDKKTIFLREPLSGKANKIAAENINDEYILDNEENTTTEEDEEEDPIENEIEKNKISNVDNDDCTACSGTGMSPKGDVCTICNGIGFILFKKEISNSLFIKQFTNKLNALFFMNKIPKKTEIDYFKLFIDANIEYLTIDLIFQIAVAFDLDISVAHSSGAGIMFDPDVMISLEIMDVDDNSDGIPVMAAVSDYYESYNLYEAAQNFWKQLKYRL